MSEQHPLSQELHRGRPIVACLPLYPPVELFASFGASPVVTWGFDEALWEVPLADACLQWFTCPVARRATQVLLSWPSPPAALFAYNACDTLRNLPEVLLARWGGRPGAPAAGKDAGVRFFPFHVPVPGSDPAAARSYLRERVEELVALLEDAFGTPFSPAKFEESAASYHRLGSLLAEVQRRVATGQLGFGQLASLARFAATSPVEDAIARAEGAVGEAEEKPETRDDRDAVPVLVSGVVPPPSEACEAMEEAGLRVVENDVALMSRTYLSVPEPVGDPAEYYEQLYLQHVPCSTLHHLSDARPGHLLELVERSGAGGVVFYLPKYCEYEAFEVPYLEGFLGERGIKSLLIEVAIDGAPAGAAVRNRLEAFAEVLGCE
ncbi:MAG: hypothetical protein Kow0069_09810 [Promethearchaeota archaeon]